MVNYTDRIVRGKIREDKGENAVRCTAHSLNELHQMLNTFLICIVNKEFSGAGLYPLKPDNLFKFRIAKTRIEK